jgi:hypothetical protein
MKGIHERRVSQVVAIRARHAERKASDMEAQERPERLDEVLTRQTIPEVVQKALEWKVNKKMESEEEKQARKQGYEQCVEQRVARKMDCIHRLYLNAQDFIVNEEELSARIEKMFGTDENPVCWNNHPRSISVWQVGEPQGTSSLGHVFETKSDDLLAQRDEMEERELKRRIMRIAGELTGGKIEVPQKLEDSYPVDQDRPVEERSNRKYD